MVQEGDVVGNADRAPFHGAGPGPLGVGDNAVADLPGKVESFAVLFQHIHHPQALPVVGKAAGTKLVQRPFPRMTEGRMPQIMAQGDGLGQILIETQCPGNGAGNLGDLQSMGQPGAVMIPFRREKDLRFLLQPPKRLAVDDPVPVPLEAGPHLVRCFRAAASAAGLAQGGIAAQGQALNRLGLFADGHGVSFPRSGIDFHVPNSRIYCSIL